MRKSPLFGFAEYRGLSTEEKPRRAKDGDCVIEIDTAKVFFYSEERLEWVEFKKEEDI